MTPTSSKKSVGVLALQGDFRENAQAFRDLGVDVREVRLPGDLEGLQGLVVPGGESTVIGRLAKEFGLDEAVRAQVENGGLSVWGICAGAIWLAKHIEGRPHQERLGVLDVEIQRNAYGRQIDSFEEGLDIGDATPLPVMFIRAPVIAKCGPGVEVLAQRAGTPVWVRQGRLWATTFHPELGSDRRLQKRFLEALS